MRCAICNREITEAEMKDAWPEKRGWDRPKHLRTGEKAGSSLLGREGTGRWMHNRHAVEIDHGVATGQGTLA